ncbi:histidine phosphatase superfamily [Pisolithus thermaeus]|nr:histidine phosphatase superfamily [Pisolithus croceorrhizus]KAI6166620.1 histidine phosphatase superfamily [Pisolithus thermaeus]
MITVTFIRHGESTDNLRSVWAGWSDSPLSNHGMNQARALGESFADTHLTIIYTSPLKRAHMTATALRDAQSEPKPTLVISPLLREQHFGAAEGRAWSIRQDPNRTLEEHFANDQYPVLYDRSQRFPGGESLDDLAARADEAVCQLVLPHTLQAARLGTQDVHIALVSHGLCISEMVAALVKRNHEGVPDTSYRGLRNTAWARVTIQVKGERAGEAMGFNEDECPPLLVKVTDFNRHDHINSIKRQKGGIGRSAYDPKQQDIRNFFGGTAVKDPVEALERSESNAADEIVLEKN